MPLNVASVLGQLCIVSLPLSAVVPVEIQSDLRSYDADGIRLTLHIAVGAGTLFTFHLVRAPPLSSFLLTLFHRNIV